MFWRSVRCPARCTDTSVPACSSTRTAISRMSSFVWKLRMAMRVSHEREVDPFIAGDRHGSRLRLVAHLRRPDVYDVLARLEVAQRRVSVAAGPLEIRRIDDDDERVHLIVDVAAERDDARLVEDDRLRGGPFVQRELE